MNAFGSLIQLLQCASSNEDQITLIVDHAQTLQSDDRAALAHLLANPPTQRRVKLTSLRELLHEHIDENLFNLSKSFVGDTAETIALLWPTKSGANRSPALAEIRTQLGQTGALELPKLFQRWLSACDANGRLTLIRLATGTFKNPVAIEVMRQAFDKLGLNVEISPAKSRRPTEQPDLFTTNSTPKPGTIDTVLMYVENGRRRSQETNCTLGIWDANELVPICRVPAGEFSHEILNYAQSNTTKRFGNSRKFHTLSLVR